MNQALRTALVVLAVSLSGCASPPQRIDDICAVFEHGESWFMSWRTQAERAEAKHGIPVPVLMATLRMESGFDSNARPARTRLWGFIPWKRPSSAYGYSQALDATWGQFQSEIGHPSARRNNFADAVNFVGWYHAKTVAQLGVAPDDAANLYLAYYFGWTAYRRGDWRTDAGLQSYASETAVMAEAYATQLRSCGT